MKKVIICYSNFYCILVNYHLHHLLDEKKSSWLLFLFIILGPSTIWIAEVVHEIFGHCLFIFLLGGDLLELSISPIAPFIPSRLVWDSTGLPFYSRIVITSSGIIVGIFVSFLSLILSRWIDHILELKILLFWISFWTFVNHIAYLIVGAFTGYGDIRILIELGVPKPFLPIVGWILILPWSYIIFNLLHSIMTMIFSQRLVMSCSLMFWFVTPVLLITAESLRVSKPFSPLLAGSILILLFPIVYLIVLYFIFLASSFDPRVDIIRKES